MSMSVMTKVWDNYPGGGGSELLTLLALADWSNDDGYCFPSIAKIAQKTRLSRSQAQRVMHMLIDDGYLVVAKNAFGGDPGKSRHYRIAISKLRGRMVATGSAGATGRTDAQEGSHGCAKRGSADATLTINEPSLAISRQKSKIPACQVEAIRDLYHAALPELPKARLMGGDRKREIGDFWKWVFTEKKSDGTPRAETGEQALDWIRGYFARARDNEFIMGRTPRSVGHENWRPDLDYLISAKGRKQVIEKTGGTA